MLKAKVKTARKKNESIAQLERTLDSEKRKHIASRRAIEKLRLRIAKLKCPYKVGDGIQIKDNGKVYSVTVTSIGFAIRYRESIGPQCGSETTWLIESDKRIKADPFFGGTVFTTGFAPIRNGVHVNNLKSHGAMLASMAEVSETTVKQHGH
jgi:hypothetical protein